jgi:hypothetical protein
LRLAVGPIPEDVAMKLFDGQSAMGAQRSLQMGTQRIKTAGVVLIVMGVLALILGRISYSIRKEVVTIGPYQTPVETRRIVPLRPFGALSVLGGLILIAGGKRVHILRRPKLYR